MPKGRAEFSSGWLVEKEIKGRCSNRLAVTLRPGCGRRCRLASSAAPAESSLDLLQGAFEKSHLQCLIGDESLQVADFLSESRLARFLLCLFDMRYTHTNLDSKRSAVARLADHCNKNVTICTTMQQGVQNCHTHGS